MEVNTQTTEFADDEYDEYNVSLDPEFMPYIVDLPPSQDTQEALPLADDPLIPDAPASPKSTYSDEYSKYDLSEFTAEELAAFDDQLGLAQCKVETQAKKTTHFGNLSSGPAIEIGIEMPADVPVGGQTSKEGSFANAPPPQNPSVDATTSKTAPRSPRPYTQTSYFYRFRRWRKTLAVTDLSSPAWCEVQWEYGLLGKRHKELKSRPASFATATGKVIHVDQKAAKVLDGISKQGSRVHKALEREIHPKKVPVEVATDEEKWALRILQMIECVQSLVTLGQCREMPVFGTLHGQPILGIIDEIQRAPVQPSTRSPSSSPSRHNRKREREDASVQVTPSKPRYKKSRRSPSPSQPTITTFFNHGLHTNGTRAPESFTAELPSDDPSPRFRLHISDTKSRNSPTMPLDTDTEPAQFQLMIYHRLLSGVLANPLTSAQGFAFESIWSQIQLSSTRKFSKKFQAETGLSDVNCLVDIEPMWRSAVEMLHVDGVDDKLQIVYRTQVEPVRKKKGVRPKKDKKGKRKANTDAAPDRSREPSDVLYKQEQKDLLAAIAASLGDLYAGVQPQAEASAKVQADSGSHTPPHAEAETTAAVESVDAVTDPALLENGHSPKVQAEAAAAAVNATPQAKTTKEPEDISADNGRQSEAAVGNELPVEASTPAISPSSDEDEDSESDCADVRQRSLILGTKEFVVDNDRLDRYLSSMLELWYGKRSPVGVEASLTRRCTWCEYHDGCEWREKKAEEARRKPRTPSNATSQRE